MISGSSNSNLKGTIFDIQGLSVHDGPGCRTLIFLKGCTLNCFWCSNPEGISHSPTLMYFSAKCIGCGKCIDNCSKQAIQRENNRLIIDRSLCESCENHDCIEECHTEALRSCGYEISASKLMSIIRRDRQFWGVNGGITLTGGEPLLQIGFVKAILEECHEAYIHTAIETCGNVQWTNFEQVMPFLDWIFFDLKHTDGEQHRNNTRCDNTLILSNARRLAAEFSGRLIFRLPLIPGFNDSEKNLNEIIAFMKETGRNEINILPLHHLGREKYNVINKQYTADKHSVPSHERMREIGKLFSNAGIQCYVGSETPF